jgi:chromosome segregation protein
LLHIKRVEIQGFKSFVDRTEMRFNGTGIAAIVGPNGCGKSNLADAISWVLGEQSAKSLRGSRMEDVIFAGTRDRKPVGMASVTMTLVDPTYSQDLKNLEVVHIEAEGYPGDGHDHEYHHANGHANGLANGHANGAAAAAGPEPALEAAVNGHAKPKTHHEIVKAAGGEVTITRRLYRSGESEYLINNKIARLRDIQDIFMGSGLGPESYAIIEQGRIGQILSNKPQDRRAIIEEAAGITKFKTKRRLAEAKLEGARQNLSRVFDILEEVSRQVNSLKRQAAKAKRYEELRGEMLAHLRVAVVGRYRVLEREATKLALDLNLYAHEFGDLSAAVGTREQLQQELSARFFGTEQALTEHREQLSESKLEAERTRSKLEVQSKQVANIDERAKAGQAEAGQIEARLAQLEGELASHRTLVAELSAAAESARGRLAEKNQERESIQKQVRERESGIEVARQAVLKLMGEASGLRNQLAKVEEYLSAIERDTARCQREEQQASADLERLSGVKQQLSERMSARQLELQSLTDQRKALESDLLAKRQAATESRRLLQQLNAELSRQKARRDSLEEVISHRTYTTENVKRLFKAIESGQAAEFRPVGVFADFVEVTDSSFEKAMEEFLHEELEYVVVKNWTEAERGVEFMRTGVDGRATFLVEPPEGAELWGHEAPQDAAIKARLSDVLRFTNGLTQAPAEILPRLASCFLVEDREAARRLALQRPDCYFLTPEGVSYHGLAVTGGKKTGAGPLALKRELKELNIFVQHRQAEVNETQTKLEALESGIQSQAEELERVRQAQQTQEKDALVLDQELRKLTEEWNRAHQRLSVSRLDLDRLAKERQRSVEVKERDSAGLAAKDAARAAQEQALEASRAAVAEMQQALAQATEEHGALRAELAGLEERRKSEQLAQSRFEQQLRDLTNRRAVLQAELARWADDRARFLSNNAELEQRAAQLAQFVALKDETVAGLAALEERLRDELGEAEEALRGLRTDAQSAQERRTATELDLVKKQAELKYLDEAAQKEFQQPLEQLAAAEENDIAEETLVESEAKYQEVKARIEAMGAVNPQALEEFEEAQQRYDFLSAQRQDLLDSIKDTERAIQEIDVESRKRFGEAFEAINANFREMFKTLFGGGTGEMRLTDESNAFESGIDIVASPPGKKLQNVLLLSGGEKSLTAMALLMGIFRYQPSPFCVLDEVDAPLDEPNIMRLTNLLKEMAKQTQFVVITHAKRTMESAQALYGVTMQEPGVSKLVSVKFQPAPEQTPLQLAARA